MGSDRPKYMNYGAIGWVIGHEITHGFDDQGRHFDEEGNLVDWWHPETKKRYLKKAQCIISQYGNYTIKALDNMQLNGINTQGENIADNGGIKEAYRAYNSWVSRHGAEPRLPGVNYTPRQLFWIGIHPPLPHLVFRFPLQMSGAQNTDQRHSSFASSLGFIARTNSVCRGHSPTWMTFHGTLTAQLGQI